MSTPHGSHGHKGDNPLIQLMASMSGAAAPEHENAPPGADAAAVKTGHEADTFDVRGILYVPALVAATLVFTYVLVTTVFSFIVTPGDVKREAKGDPGSTIREREDVNVKPFNDRIGRISSTDTEPLEKNKPDTAVPQPRLEFMRQVGDPHDPAYLRTKRPLQNENNPPEVRPEDLRPDNYVDPHSGQMVLKNAAYLDKEKGVVSLPINEMMKMAVSGKKLPTRVGAKPLTLTSDDVAKSSNAGQAGLAMEKKPELKKDEKKH